MPEIERHSYACLWGVVGYDALSQSPMAEYFPSCMCGWEGNTVPSSTEASAQYTEHVRFVGDLVNVYRNAGLDPIDSEQTADSIARHVP